MADSLAAALRQAVADDAELRRLRDELAAHVSRGIAWWDDDRRRVAARRLQRLAPGLPRMVQPAALAGVAARFAGEPYYPNAPDVQAQMKAHRITGRVASTVTEFFRGLQDGDLVATGRPSMNPVTSMAIPAELWSASATTIDMVTSDVLIGGERAFIAVEVQPPAPPPRSASRSALDRFTRAFSEVMQASYRHFTLDELVGAVRQHLGGGVSAKEIVAALRRSPVSARAGAGRRAAALTPTPAELAEAARRAAETSA